MIDFAENGVALKGPLVRSLVCSAALRLLARLLHSTPLCSTLFRSLARSLCAASLTHLLTCGYIWHHGAKVKKETTSALWYQMFPWVSKRVSGVARSEQASERSKAERSEWVSEWSAAEQTSERTSGPFKTTPFSAKSIIVRYPVSSVRTWRVFSQ